jgi:hypothetical protein
MLRSYVINITEWEPDDEELAALVAKVKVEDKPPVLFNNRARRKEELGQPERDPALQKLIDTYIDVDGLKAHVLIDPGCTTDLMSSDFAKVAKVKPVRLEKPMALQLAVSGSRSKVNFGTWAPLKLDGLEETRYFDIANVDQFDMILGTPFLWANRITLAFEGDGAIMHQGRKLNVPIGIIYASQDSKGRRWFRHQPSPKIPHSN